MITFYSQVQRKRKRQYPGEDLADILFKYVESLSKSSAERIEILEVLVGLLNSASKSEEQNAIDYLQEVLQGEVSGADAMTLGREGIVIKPLSPIGKAAFAILRLLLDGRLNQIVPCINCGVLFYARFKRQRFCGDPTRKCQWKSYHTPEWRKRNREQNLRHQQALRKRLFEKGRR